MNKNIFRTVIIFSLASVVIASVICVLIFKSAFAERTVDYFSFLIALFLIIEGFYMIGRYRNESYFPNHFFRCSRIIIGACIFTIHIMQYIYRT